ncbi:MAG TPA: hypothetical protein VHE09_16255 [Rhizomicrobium sp.]|nr:hypothetical protein [Rhizomicrobium sp.]
MLSPGHFAGLALAILTFATTGTIAADAGSSAGIVSITATPKLASDALASGTTKFVDSRTRLTQIDQVARWRDPICPTTDGLPQAFNTFISDRIRAIAAKAGAPAEKSCKPNVEIMFTAVPQKMADEVADRSPWLFGTHLSSSARHLATVSHPIQAWYVTATLEPSGRQTTDTPFDPVGVTGTNRKVFGSRLGENKSSVFENILIVADASKIAGHDVGTVADYLAMLALSQIDQSAGCAPLPSITDAFSACTGAGAVNSLTDADLEYLTGLYAVSPNVPGATARSDIARHMAGALAAR